MYEWIEKEMNQMKIGHDNREDFALEVAMHLVERELWESEEIGLVRRAIRNKLLDLGRKKQPESVELDEEMLIEDQFSLSQYKIDWLDKQLKEMSWQDKKLLRLRLAGFTYREIAEQTDLEKSAIQGRLASLSQKLAEEWSKYT